MHVGALVPRPHEQNSPVAAADLRLAGSWGRGAGDGVGWAGAGPAPNITMGTSAAWEPVGPVLGWRAGGPGPREPHGNFLQGARWSPDGACLLAAAADRRLRRFDLPAGAAGPSGRGPPFAAGLEVQEGEQVYDYAWFPGAAAAEPATMCFAATCRGHPIHLWDALTGARRASYRAYDSRDEVMAAVAVAMDPDGHRLVGGFAKAIAAWDVQRPGRDCALWPTHSKASPGQAGLIASLHFNPDRSQLLAAGCYDGSAGVYDAGTGERALELVLHAKGHRAGAGVTQVQWSPDGNFLYAGARRDGSILCWDVRHTRDEVYRLQRATVRRRGAAERVRRRPV